MMAQYWRNYLIFLAGDWLLLSPWLLDYYTLSYAAWSAVLGGILVMLIQSMAIVRPGSWEVLLDIVVGCYLVASPLILGFTASTAAATNTIIVGTLIVLLAPWGLLDLPSVQRSLRDRLHHN